MCGQTLKPGNQNVSHKIIILIYVIIVITLHVIPTGSGVAEQQFYIGNLRADYLLHTAIFIPWMILVRLHLNRQNSTGAIRVKKASLWFIAGLLLAVFSESIQLYLPHRSFNVMDVISNATGIVVGGLVFVVRRRC